jgi:ubiquinone biosynthesis protein
VPQSTSNRLIEAPYTVYRALVLGLHSFHASFRFALRIIANKFRKQRESSMRIAGRTLAGLFENLGPTYLKLGQILSTRRDLLSPAFVDELERLQDDLSPAPFDSVPGIFQQELGVKLEEVFADSSPIAIASASVSTVYAWRLRNGQKVAVKIRRPGIVRLVQADLRLLRSMGAMIAILPLFRNVPVRRALEEFFVCVERQLDFREEAKANRRIRNALRWQPRVTLPALIEELCSPSILTMEFIEEFAQPPEPKGPGQRDALVAALRTLYCMIFVDGLIHCDLHHGNLRLKNDGRALLIDFGFVGEMQTADQEKFAEFFYGISANKGARCAELIIETALFTSKKLNYPKFEAEMIALVKSVSGKSASEFKVADFVVRLFNVQRRNGIVGTTASVMAIASLLIMEGIAKDIYPDLDFQRESFPFLIGALVSSKGKTTERKEPKREGAHDRNQRVVPVPAEA